MRHLALILLTLACLTPAQAAPDALTARLVYVASPGEAFTPEQRAAALKAAQAALDWWQARAPLPVAYEVRETREIEVDDPFAEVAWMRPYVTWKSPALEIYIVANFESRHLLYGRFAGYAAEGYHAVFAVASGEAPEATAATIAHELGHVLYGLPDLYTEPGACTGLDLMCYPLPAYRVGAVGCQSSAALGNPCKRTYLPAIDLRATIDLSHK